MTGSRSAPHPSPAARPLTGLRVVEVATGVAGPYTGRLLAMLGATVVKVEPAGGDPTRRLRVDDRPSPEPAAPFVHLNVGKRSVRADGLDVAATRRWADVVISDRVRTEFGPWEGLSDSGTGPLLVSVTAWGLDAAHSGSPSDELLVQAGSGLLAATEHEDDGRWRFPGWQTQYLAGAYAAVAALTSLGGVRHIEVSWIDTALSAVECQAAATLYALTSRRPDIDAEERRQAGFQNRTFPSGVFPCADGHVVPGTVRGKDWVLQCELYGRPELATDRRFGWGTRWRHREELRAEIGGWYRDRTRREIFDLALGSGWSAGMVLTGRDVLTDPHLRARSFLGPVAGVADATAIARPWLVQDDGTDGTHGTDGDTAAPLRLAGAGEDTAWFDPTRTPSAPRPAPADVAGLRVLELTWAWAGPFVGRFLAALGADVVRIETGSRPDGWRTRFRFRDLGADPGPGGDPDDLTYDGSAQFNSLNRGKRAVSVDLAHPDGARVFTELLDRADVLVVNMNHRMLADRGLDEAVRRRVRDGLVHITMPALGASGPDCAMPGFGMLIEGMGGFAGRHGPPGDGARTSPTYYPDAVSGVHATVAVAAALARRGEGGPGCSIDLSQQETLWMQFGEAVVLAAQEGRDPDRTGNAEPGTAASGLLDAADGQVAYILSTTAELEHAARLLGGCGDLAVRARARTATEVRDLLCEAGGSAAVVRDVRDRHADGTLAGSGMLETVEHPVTGSRDHLRIPVRRDGVPMAVGEPAPLFDQHTDEVLGEWLGMDPVRLGRLRADGAVGTVPAGCRPRVSSPGR